MTPTAHNYRNAAKQITVCHKCPLDSFVLVLDKWNRLSSCFASLLTARVPTEFWSETWVFVGEYVDLQASAWVLPEERPLQHCFSLLFEELKMKAKYEGQVSMPR